MGDTITISFLLNVALASLVLSESNTTSSRWQTNTNMADEIHKDTTAAIIEGSRFDQDGFSEYSQYNTTFGSPDSPNATNRLVSRNAPSGVAEQIIISDGESTNEASAKYVATPPQPETWYRDSEVRHLV
ncbi:hypothetical protein BaRGS_00013036 [Batillaria attramentaria]|uniref:Uncharacterized protein n=1 Tax=Batillaria attramentaria TaxID=370345 RepID=A0ABD0L964_9CAEN